MCSVPFNCGENPGKNRNKLHVWCEELVSGCARQIPKKLSSLLLCAVGKVQLMLLFSSRFSKHENLRDVCFLLISGDECALGKHR